MKTYYQTAMTLLILITGLVSSPTFANNRNFGFSVSEDRIQTNKKERSKKLRRLRMFRKSVEKDSNLANFSYHQKIYVVDANLKTVWNAYTQVKPNDAWSGPLNTFEQLYSATEDTIYEHGDSLLPAIELGMVYELNLRIAKILDVGVSFQITEIDTINHAIEFTYGKHNKSHGKQRIVFKQDGSKTFIVHYSYFKSNSKFRDKFLYPKFHEKCMDEFHANLKKLILSEQTTTETNKAISYNP